MAYKYDRRHEERGVNIMRYHKDTIKALKIAVLDAVTEGMEYEYIEKIFKSAETEADHDEIRHDIKDCNNCKLREGCTQVVVSKGSEQAEIMFIGEAPGREEDEQGVPFIGKSGELMDNIIKAAGWKREDIYISNTVKCRPPGNRDPKTEEIAQCKAWLDREITMVNPKVIICWGRIAAQTIIHPQFKITKEHGTWFADNEGRKLIATYHPAFILRKGKAGEELKVQVWDDIQKVMKEIRPDETL